ncbi:MAG TPA: hypothetical protein VGD23_00780, partial [Sphingomicrobium sp.]
MTFEAVLRSATASPFDQDALDRLAKEALNAGEEEQAIPVLQRALARAPTARLWQWKGLLERAIEHHQQALDSLGKAAEIDPTDISIAHGLARVTMEAGLDARPLYRRARQLAPQNGQILIGLTAAMAAMGESEQAASKLQAGVEGSPMWLEGHKHLGQMLATLGRADEATASLERALERMPTSAPLWETLLNLQLRRGAYETLNDIVDRAEKAGVESPELRIYRGIYASELDPGTYPTALFDSAPPEIDAVLGPWRIRHLLRVGAVEAALPLIDRELARDASGHLWAYASTAWRLAGDPRSDWLEGDDRLVSVIDLSDSLPPIDQLAATLRSLHIAKGEYLDQSVRGGTQTDGPLFSRIDPVIRQLRSAIVGAVERHIAQLPPTDPAHPTLRRRRDRRVRFSGSWSVRLR